MVMTTKIYTDLAFDFVEDGTTDETLFTGFASECGEVMKERMKEVRYDLEKGPEICEEMCDVLWYVTIIAHNRGYTLEELMERSIAKLEDRLLNPKKILGGNLDT